MANIDFDALKLEQEQETLIIYWDQEQGRWFGVCLWDPQLFGGLKPEIMGSPICGDAEAIICAKWGWHI